MFRRVLIVVVAGLTAVAALPISGFASTPTLARESALCQITGTADFGKTPLTTTAKPVKYTFTGTADCKNSTDPTLTSGKITASGSGASVDCSHGNTTGKAVFVWNNKKKTTLPFSETGVGAVVNVSGTASSKPKETTEFAGDAAQSVLVFQVDPTLCAGKGVKTATFTGVAEIDNYSLVIGAGQYVACQITGTANFGKTPLTTTAKAVKYTFTGSGSNCQTNAPGISAITKIASTGTGAAVSCAGGPTSGTAFLTWNNKTVSKLVYTTTGQGPLIVVQGTITAGQFQGQAFTSLLVFHPNPQDCVGKGVVTAPFDGIGGGENVV